MFLKLATVNLIKHRKRTLLILFAIMMSVLVMEVIAGMFHGMRVNFFENLAQESGHIQITAEGREDSLNPYSLEYTISGYKEIIAEIQQLGGVQAAEEILVFGGLLQFDERNITLSGTGVRQDTSFYSHVKEGLQEGR
ncbi:MAG: ABC transporter permease, partial [Spirochaeta sp.]